MTRPLALPSWLLPAVLGVLACQDVSPAPLRDDSQASVRAPSPPPAPVAPGAAAAAASPPSAGTPWNDEPLPPVPADALVETRDEPLGRRVTVARSRDGRELWVTYGRPADRAPLRGYERVADSVRTDPARGGRLLPVFELEGEDEGMRSLYVEPGSRYAVDPSGYGYGHGPDVRVAPGAGSFAEALRATFRARAFQRCPVGPRDRCIVLGSPEQLYALRARVVPETGWRIVDLPAVTRAAAASGPVARSFRGRGRAAELRIDVRSGSQAHPTGDDDDGYGGPWSAWLVRGSRSVFLFGASDGEAEDGGVVRFDHGGRAELYAWVRDASQVRLFAVRLDESLTPLGRAFAREARATFEVDCGNVFTDTIPAMVLTDDGAPLLAHVWRGQQTSVLYRAVGRPGRVVPAHHEASFYEIVPPGDVDPPLYRLRGRPGDPAAWLEPVLAL